MKIINSIDSAITKGHWHNPGADFYNKICSNKEALKEAYLVIGENVGENVPFTRSGCKYPHHSINKNGDLVLNVAGVKAAYQRAKQMGIFSGEVKEHLMRHYKELDIYKGSQMESDKKITENFEYIESVLGIDENKYFMEWEENSSIDELSTWIDDVAHNGFDEYDEASHGKLKHDFRFAYDAKTGHKLKIVYSLDNINVDYAGHAYNPQDIKEDDNNSKELSKNDKANQEVNTNISRKGNIDHRSNGQKVIAIIDEVTNIKLPHATTISYLASSDKNDSNLGQLSISRDEINKRINSGYANISDIKVGEIDNTPSFKSTKIFKGLNALTKSMDAQLAMKSGRGVKPDDLENIYKKGNIRLPTYNNPNKKEGKAFLKDFLLDQLKEKPNEFKELVRLWNSEAYTNTSMWKWSKQTKITSKIINLMIKELINTNDGELAKKLIEYRKQLLDERFIESEYNDLTCGISIGKDIIPYIEKFCKLVNDGYNNDKRNSTIIANIAYNCGFPSHSLSISKSIEYHSTPIENNQFIFYIESSRPKFIENTILINNIDDKLKKFEECVVNISEYKKDLTNSSMFVPNGYNLENSILNYWTNSDIIIINFNESFMSEYINNYYIEDLENAKSPKELLSIMNNIEYDESIKDWKLKIPPQTWKVKKGNCHDQSLLAKWWFDKMGYICGQLFFIEMNDGESTGGNAHTLTWYQKDDKYFWFEHSWENKRGIHGPYNSIDELKEDVYREWESDDDINSHKYKRIEFFDIPKYKPGMTLGEYINSWTKDDIINESTDDNDIEKQWFITSDDGVDNCCIKVKGYNKPMRGRSSMITIKYMLDEWYIMSKKNNGGDYGVPGGGWDKDEDPMDAAIRELHEEVQCNISNVKHMGTLIEYHEDAAQWVKDHVPEKDWWYGYYSAIFVGVYAGVFKGEVEDRDKETGYSFKPLKVVIDRFPKEYQDAIIKYIDNKYYQESVFTEADENDPPELDEQSEDKPEEVKEEPKQEETPAEEPDNDDIMNDNIDEEPPELDEEPVEEPQQEEQKEEPKEEEPKKEEKPLSMPKQTDAAEKGKNGVNRKKLYIAFIEWCKEYNSKNTFGSIFDKDIFHNVYPFVPEELRYFYRLANPILCVLAGDLTFFQVSELKMINKNNPNINEMLIFAATNNDLRVFNNKDKKVYLATEENGIKLGQVLGESFDLYIQNMIKKGDILNAPLENSNEE